MTERDAPAAAAAADDDAWAEAFTRRYVPHCVILGAGLLLQWLWDPTAEAWGPFEVLSFIVSGLLAATQIAVWWQTRSRA